MLVMMNSQPHTYTRCHQNRVTGKGNAFSTLLLFMICTENIQFHIAKLSAHLMNSLNSSNSKQKTTRESTVKQLTKKNKMPKKRKSKSESSTKNMMKMHKIKMRNKPDCIR